MKKYLAIVPIIFIASYFLLSSQLSNLKNLKKIYVGERIRDMIYNENQKMLLMFLENTASIGVLKF